MEGLYTVGASEKIRTLEEDLEKSLQDLRSEVEEGDFLGTAGLTRVFSSLPIPQDVSYFRQERKQAIKKALQIHEAMPLKDISEVMKWEILSCNRHEYTVESLPLLLYHFFSEQVSILANLKYLHLLRWTRYCEHSKVVKTIYPEFQKRLKLIMTHYQDAVERAKRLSSCRESFFGNTEGGTSLIKSQDLEIYTSWLVCHLHATKRIHSILKIIQWLPYSHRSFIHPDLDVDEKGHEKDPPPFLKTTARRLSKVGKAAVLIKRASIAYVDPNIPSPPLLHLPGHQAVAPVVSTLSNVASASGGGLACDEVSLKLPLNDDSSDGFSTMLNFLLGCYGIDVYFAEGESKAAEMDMFNLVLRKFKKVFYKQAQLRKFPVYDTIPEAMEAGIRKNGSMTTLKKESNWIPYIFLRPEVNGDQERAMTRLKDKNYIDEVLRVFSKFFHIENGQKVLSGLREHSKLVHEPERLQSFSVTTHRAQKNTSTFWNKIFNYSNRSTTTTANDILDFETNLAADDPGGVDESEFDISSAVEVLGLEDDDEKRHPLISHGAYLSYVILRHLRIRDLQRTCLSTLNYFRSVERSLTIFDSELTVEGQHVSFNNRKVFYGADTQGINSQQYMHNSPVDSRIDENSFIECSEIENHFDYYVMEDGRMHVQDSKGFFVMYDTALTDFRELEQRLLLIGSHFISKDKEKRSHRNQGENSSYGVPKGDFDLGAYSHQGVDRFGVLLDLWTNEVLFLENKRQLIDCYYEAYQHVPDPKERRHLAQIIVNLIHRRPRYDLGADYFVRTYRDECICLRLHCNFIKSVLDKQIDEQREYIQRVSRADGLGYGVPYRIVPIQNIAVNTNRPILKYVYMMEFHPSLGLISQIPRALKKVLDELVHIHKPMTPTHLIAMERHLFEVTQSQFDTMPAVGSTFSSQLRRDLFTDVFIEDPLFVCEVGQSLSTPSDRMGSRTSFKEGQKKMLKIWGNLLEIITIRHRLVETAHETEILTKLYKRRAKELGLDDCHAYLRAVAFEVAQQKPERDMQQLDATHLLDDESKIDRYQPNTLSLAVQELDEKHVASFSFRSRDGLVQAIQPGALEKIMATTMVQICHKCLLATSIMKIENCLRFEGPDGLRKISSYHLVPVEDSSSLSSSNMMTSALSGFTQPKGRQEIFRRVKAAFVSVQFEKSFLRDKMLNKFLKEKERKASTLKAIDEIVRLKRTLIEEYGLLLHKRTAQHALRSQIIAYYFSLSSLMSEFPTTRDAHFIMGEVPDPEEEIEDFLSPDSGVIKRRPSRVISSDGKRVLNLWFIPHYTEILNVFQELSEELCLQTLKVMLRLVSAIHDICQYLCAHAKLGSSHARLGSQKLQFSGVTADWGGTEGIGAELRAIQRQINHLGDPCDPLVAAEFLERKRDVMFLEFDLAVRHLVRSTFLSTGKEAAFESITNCMHFALQDLSSIPRPSVFSCGLSLPEPLNVMDEVTEKLFPWRTFLHRFGPFPCMPWSYFTTGYNFQLCLAGLSDTDRHIVNGEVLGVSLLLEDVLNSGRPDLSALDSRQDGKGHHASPKSAHTSGNHECLGVLSSADMIQNPLEALGALRQFLRIWSKLEVIKLDWGCRRLGTSFIRTAKQFSNYSKAYKADVLQVIYRQITSKRAYKGDDYLSTTLVDDYEQLPPPSGVSEFELKARQLIRLLENLEATMIHDVMRRLSREQTLVISERSREDATLPTDLWKKPTMKENFTMAHPMMVEEFAEKLMSDHLEDEDTVSFTKEHLNACLVLLSSATVQREKLVFDSYASFYENLLRQQHQQLYMKEQEIKQLKDDYFKASHNTEVDADCQLADKAHALLLEITALRAKVTEMSSEIREKEREVYRKLKVQFTELTVELFNAAFGMKNRFQQFKSALYDDILSQLGEVRNHASESMKKLRVKAGAHDETDVLSQRLIKAEELREAQWESKNLAAMVLKMKRFSQWNRIKTGSKSFVKLSDLKEKAESAKKQCLEMNLIHEEKELLLRQELASIRKALSHVEKECQSLRRKLSQEQKLNRQRSNAQIQEAISQRQLDIARSSNIDKLIAELDEKEERLRELSELNDHDMLLTRRSQTDSKKAVRNMMAKLAHERSLKTEAFERVDDLQKQVEDYEDQITELTKNPSGSYHTSCFPQVPGGRTSPQRRPATHASTRHHRAKSSGHERILAVIPGKGGHQSLQLPKCGTSEDGSPVRLTRPRTVSARIRTKIRESLLSELDAGDRK